MKREPEYTGSVIMNSTMFQILALNKIIPSMEPPASSASGPTDAAAVLPRDWLSSAVLHRRVVALYTYTVVSSAE